MTEIGFKNNSMCYEIELKGHSTGSSEVCAGISAIVYSVLGYIANEEFVELDEDSTIVSDGYCKLAFKGRCEAQAAFNIAKIGLMQIAVQYPLYCRIKKYNEFQKKF